MSAMVLLLACLAAASCCERAGKLPDNAPAALNAYVINVALPALALTHLHATELQRDRPAGKRRRSLADARNSGTLHRLRREPDEPRRQQPPVH